MSYVLKEGKKFLQEGGEGFVTVKKLSSATKFTSTKQAKRFMDTMPMQLRNRDIVLFEVNGTMVTPVEGFTVDQQESAIPGTTSEAAPFEFDDRAIRENILSAINEIKRLQENREHLVKMVQKADQATSDILHYLEFNNPSASEGYKLTKQLKDLRIERRKYKDALGLLDVVENEGKSLLDNTFIKKVSYVYTRTYEPRVLGDLFEGKSNTNHFN